MARTVTEILDQINTAKQRIGEIYTAINNEISADADLSALTSVSKTAVYRLWMYIWAVMSFIQEELFGEAKAEMQTIVDNAIPGTDRWLALEVKKFQYGDSLSFDDETGDYFYAVIDPAKQIIFRVAISSNAGQSTVKVAKDDGSGNPIALSTDQLNALKSYIQQIQYAGSNIITVSLPSDKIKLPITIYYDAITPLPTLQSNVEAAINGYLAELDFNGTFYISKLVDAIQAVENVEDVVIGSVEARSDAGAFNPVSRIYLPVSGYLEVDSGFPLSTTITYEVS